MVLDLIVTKTNDGFTAEIPSINGLDAWAHQEDEVIEKAIEMMKFYLNLDDDNEIKIDTDQGKVDFATLNADDQMKAISELLKKRDKLQKTIRENPLLKIIFEPLDTDIIERNRSTIVNEYSLIKYAKRLEGIYKKITQ